MGDWADSSRHNPANAGGPPVRAKRRRRFPLLYQGPDARRLRKLGAPKSVPWALAETGRGQAMRNHGQSLEELARRGGLSPAELLAALEGRGLWSRGEAFTDASALPKIVAMMAAASGEGDDE